MPEHQTFLMRNALDEYTLYTYNLLQFGSIQTLSKMNEPELHKLVVFLREMHSNDKSSTVWFPQNYDTPEVLTRISKRGKDNIILAINVGSHLLSEMTDDEFHEVVFELETIPMQPIGTKVYFPPLN
jgi:hypothetical protein